MHQIKGKMKFHCNIKFKLKSDTNVVDKLENILYTIEFR